MFLLTDRGPVLAPVYTYQNRTAGKSQYCVKKRDWSFDDITAALGKFSHFDFNLTHRYTSSPYRRFTYLFMRMWRDPKSKLFLIFSNSSHCFSQSVKGCFNHMVNSVWPVYIHTKFKIWPCGNMNLNFDLVFYFSADKLRENCS